MKISVPDKQRMKFREDIQDLFQPKPFYDSMTFSKATTLPTTVSLKYLQARY